MSETPHTKTPTLWFIGQPAGGTNFFQVIIGMNFAQKKEVNYKGLGKMALYWVLTFPMAALLAGFIYYGFNLFGLF